MRNGRRIGVVIPAFDEEAAIGRVLADIPDWVDEIVVADNASTDKTAEVAKSMGAIVSYEAESGYGATCLAGLEALSTVDVVVFLDGDYSDYPEDMHEIVDPITVGHFDFVLASRNLGGAQAGSLTPQQVFGNWLATTLIRMFWGHAFSDLGPFRAISFGSLERLNMADRNFGWTVEMQIKAVEAGLRMKEVKARYRPRIGHSKVSGTVRGSVMAGWTILSIIGVQGLRRLWEKLQSPALGVEKTKT